MCYPLTTVVQWIIVVDEFPRIKLSRKIKCGYKQNLSNSRPSEEKVTARYSSLGRFLTPQCLEISSKSPKKRNIGQPAQRPPERQALLY